MTINFQTTFVTMKEGYQIIIQQAKKEKKAIKRQVAKLRKMRKGDLDKKIHQLHDDAFRNINCLECANCCKTTGPLFTQKDISRIASHLNQSIPEFIGKYLQIDEDQDHVLQTVPCSFLGDDNHCSIYDVRPKACREYPHTDRVNQLGILNLTEKNAAICPAVAEIFNHIAK